MTIEEILRLAKENDASDVHMAPGSPLMFRMNGCLVPQGDALMQEAEIVSIIKAIATKQQLADLERDGELNFTVSISNISRVRASIFRQRGMYAASFRMLSYDVPALKQLGIPASAVELANRKSGLILVTGIAGSGKSTTLASFIEWIAERDYKNIITIENSIEYLHSSKKSIISQREIGVDTENYASGVRAALRQDPDVIVIGELQDVDTISAALAAAENGYLVFSALHTSNAADAITRIIEVFPAYQQQQVRMQLAAVLNGVVVQQLLPRFDEHGRVAAFEVLIANAAVKNLIREGKNHQISGVIQKSRKEGMQSMDDAILDAYMRSEIAVETAISYAHEPDSMIQKVRIF